MASEYVRELCMAEFNRFWLERVKDLKPTAGYPGDARSILGCDQASREEDGAIQAAGLAEEVGGFSRQTNL